MGSALSYNEEKVKEGEAEVIAEVNVDEDHLSILDTFARLETMNIRSKDVSFHMSVNPAEGEKLTREQVKELMDGNQLTQALMLAPLWRHFAEMDK